MENRFSRTQLLLGVEKLNTLKNSTVALFGCGGVGGYVAEALARSGVGAIHLIDNDTISLTNINRQIIALSSTVGRLKVEVLKERILDINPDCVVTVHNLFILPENIDSLPFNGFDYVVDAIDTVTAKIALVCKCKQAGVPIISCMGTGNKLNPTLMKVADIYKTSVCPLAKVMRRELKKRGIESLDVCYSEEEPLSCVADSENGRHAPGSNAFVPAVAGFVIASHVIKNLGK